MPEQSLGMLSVELQAGLQTFLADMQKAAQATAAFSGVVDKEMAKVGGSMTKAENKLTSFVAAHQAGFKKAGIAVGAFGTAVLAASALAITGYANMGDSLDEMSQRTGVGAKALSQYGYAARQSGTDIGGIEMALRLMQKKFGDVKGVTDEAAAGLGDVSDAAQKTADKAKDVADAQRDSAETITESAKDVSRAARDEAETITQSAEDVARAKKDEAVIIKDSAHDVEDAVKDRAQTVKDAAKDEIRAARDLADELKDIEDARISATERATKSQRRIAEGMADQNNRRVREERNAAESIADLREREAERITAADKDVWKKQQEIRTKGATPENQNALKESEAERAKIIAQSAKTIARAERDMSEQLGDLAKSTARSTRDANEDRKQSSVDLNKTLSDLKDNEAKAIESNADRRIATNEKIKAADLKVIEATEQGSVRMAAAAQRTADVVEAAELRKRAAAEKTADTIEATEKRKRDAEEKVAAIIAKPIETKGKAVGPAGVMDEEGGGGPPALQTLKSLGLTLDSIKGKNPEEMFNVLLEALAKIEDPTKRAALAMQLFGRSGTAVLPLIAKGIAGFRAMCKEADDLGVSVENLAAAQAGVFADSLTSVKDGLKGISYEISKNLLPVLQPLIDKTLEIIKGVIAWAKENPGLTRLIGELTIAAAGLAFVLSPFIIGLAILPSLKLGFLALAPVIGPVVTALLIPAATIAAIYIVSELAKSIMRNWEPLKAFFKSLWEDLKTGWANLGDGIIGIWEGIGRGIKKWIDYIIAIIQWMVDGVKAGINAVIKGINAISPKNIPLLHTGGMFRAETAGGQGLAMLQDGEQVIPAGAVNRNTSESRSTTIEVNNPLSAVDKALLIREVKRSISIDSYVSKGLQGAI